MKINTILLCAHYTDQLSYYDDWIDAFRLNGKFSLSLINAADTKQRNEANLKEIEKSDLIILHHSILADTLKYILPFKEALNVRKGKLFSFVGNEVNLPILGMAPKIKFLKEIQPEYILTQLLEEAGIWLYSDCENSKVVSIPHALNPNAFKYDIPHIDRKIDIGCRTARYGIYLGDNDRNRIIDFFQTLAKVRNLNVDFGLNNNLRLNRQEWGRFLNQCKATISTEAGSFYLDQTDQLLNEIIAKITTEISFFMRSESLPDNKSIIRKTYRTVIPKSLRMLINRFLSKHFVLEDILSQETKKLEKIRDDFFQNKTKAPVYTKCISSRHFDAVGTKTLQVVFPGRYNDILIPDLHYVPLMPDFSNIEEVLSIISDGKKAHKIVEEAYLYVMRHHTYQHRIEKILKLFE